MRHRMAAPVIFDGRNLYRLDQVAAAGFDYYSVGRAAVLAAEAAATRSGER
jgi:UDPglucose 6-dehydrogenase